MSERATERDKNSLYCSILFRLLSVLVSMQSFNLFQRYTDLKPYYIGILMALHVVFTSLTMYQTRLNRSKLTKGFSFTTLSFSSFIIAVFTLFQWIHQGVKSLFAPRTSARRLNRSAIEHGIDGATIKVVGSVFVCDLKLLWDLKRLIQMHWDASSFKNTRSKFHLSNQCHMDWI